jgi:hypothetical protein
MAAAVAKTLGLCLNLAGTEWAYSLKSAWIERFFPGFAALGYA